MSTIALIGDSHTEAYFPHLRSILETNGHQVVGQVSKRGWATYSFNKDPSYIREAIERNPDVILVSLGGNNSKLNAGYGKAVTEFLSNIGYPRKRVIWVGPAKAIREDVERRHKWTNEWLKDNLPNNIIYIDSYDFTQQGHAPDGVHFTSSFYKNEWAKRVGEQTLSALSLPIVLYKAKQNVPLILLMLSLTSLGYAVWRRYGKTR